MKTIKITKNATTVKKISIRDLARGTKGAVKSAQHGHTLVITVRGEPVAALTHLRDDIALRVLPLGHPRVEAILQRASDRRGGTPADKVISRLREALGAVGEDDTSPAYIRKRK